MGKQEMVVVAETGCLPARRGQELPLALWVDAPIHPPAPGDKHWPRLCFPQAQPGSVVVLHRCQWDGLGEHWDQATARVPRVHGDLPQLHGSSGQCHQPNESKFRVVLVAAENWMGMFLPNFQQEAVGRQHAWGKVCGASSSQPGFY